MYALMRYKVAFGNESLITNITTVKALTAMYARMTY
jgi:hypothetical protein